MNNPLVSVIVSTYNNSNFLEKSIQSLLDQSYKNIEILILDDKSTDNSKTILEEISNKHCNLKILHNDKNLGLTKSLNKLIAIAKGEIIARHDTDDLSMAGRIEKQVSLLVDYNLDFCTTRAIKMNTKKKTPNLSFYFPPKLLIKFKNPFIHGTLAIKKKVLRDVGGYNEKFIYAQDYDLFNRLINSNYNFDVIKKPLYILNTKNNISSLKKIEQSYYAECVRKNINPDITKYENLH